MPHKILLIRFSSIGDIVLTSPVIRCLKQQLPESELHVLTRKGHETLFETNPYVDKTHVYDHNFKQLLPVLDAENYDHIVDLHKNFRSMRVRLALRKPCSSFPKLNLKKYLLVRFKINLLPDIHIVDRYFKAVKKLGVENDGQGLDFFIPDRRHVSLAEAWPFITGGYYAVVIGGKHQTKIFPAEKLIEACRKLDKPVVLLGGPEDAEKAADIVAAMPEKAVNCCGKYSLHQSASILKQSHAVLTNDTGLMHIAAALRKPILSIWGSTVPAFGMYPYLPTENGLSVMVENQSLKCRPCSKLGFSQCPKGHFKCMMDIDPTEVAVKLNRLGTFASGD